MRIGLAFDSREPTGTPEGACDKNQPDDMFEEYDPPETISAIADAIGSWGHDVVRLGGGRGFVEKVLQGGIDFVFNISEGRGAFRGREGQVPSVLEMLDIPYSFSDPVTLGISLDKSLTKKLVASAGVSTAPDVMLRSGEDILGYSPEALGFPVFIKPAFEGSSKGIRSASRADDLPDLMEKASRMLKDYRQPVLFERFISGDECTVGVAGDPPEVVGSMRIRPKAGPDPDFIYSVEVKRDFENQVVYDIPPPFGAEKLARLHEDAIAAYEAIGCRDAARVDFRFSGATPIFLEINPLPGLSPAYGDLPILARGAGMTYRDLIGKILESAFRRCFPKY